MPTWSPQEDALILNSPELSAGELARRLVGRTRNSVIGRWNRLRQEGKPSARPALIVRKNFSAPHPVVARAPFPTSRPPCQLRECVSPVPESERRQLEEVAVDQCRWIFGDVKYDPLWHYCNQQAVGGAYCPEHKTRVSPTK